jgi:hypothetical protein
MFFAITCLTNCPGRLPGACVEEPRPTAIQRDEVRRLHESGAQLMGLLPTEAFECDDACAPARASGGEACMVMNMQWVLLGLLDTWALGAGPAPAL